MMCGWIPGRLREGVEVRDVSSRIRAPKQPASPAARVISPAAR